MLKRRRPLPNFWRDRASTAALEFALVLPVMLLILAGVYDLSEACIIRSEIYYAAQIMAASASAEAVQADGSTALTYDQVQQVESSIWALVPSLRSGQHNGTPMSVTLSSLLFYTSPFNPCVYGQKSSCTYFADVVWSEAYAGGDSGATFQSNIASPNCGGVASDTSNQVTPNTAISGTNNIINFRTFNVTQSNATFSDTGTAQTEAGISPILIVNIQYTYTPLFNLFFIKPVTFWVDGYWPIRSLKKIAPVTKPDIYNNGNFTVEPLTNAFTTINATSLQGADVNNNDVCIDNGISNPGPTS